MNDVAPEIKLELLRNNILIHTIEPYSYDNPDLKFNMESSMNSFPLLTRISSSEVLNEILMTYSKGDILRCLYKFEKVVDFEILFEGGFFSKTLSYTAEPKCLEFSVISIHSFYRLSLLELQAKREFTNVTFESFVRELLEVSNINVEVNISSELAPIRLTGMSNNTNLFRLFKEVFIMIDAIVTFNSDNTVDISSRASRLNHIRSQEVQTIHQKDIISSGSFEHLGNMVRSVK